MTTAAALMTIDQFVQTPEHERYELINGEMVPLAENDAEHGLMAGELLFWLRQHTKATGVGQALDGSVRYHVKVHEDDEGESFRQCDASLIVGKTWREIIDAHPLRGAPDLVIEVVSRYDNHNDVFDKAMMWLGNGARLVWVVSQVKLVHVFKPNAVKPDVCGIDDMLTGEPVAPGLAIPVATLYP